MGGRDTTYSLRVARRPAIGHTNYLGVIMGIDDMVNAAKDAVNAAGMGDAVDGAVDQAAEAIKNVTPDAADGMVDQAAAAIKDQI